jgi:hypothetical protein
VRCSTARGGSDLIIRKIEEEGVLESLTFFKSSFSYPACTLQRGHIHIKQKR